MILLLLWGCGELECSDSGNLNKPTYENWAEGFFLSKCQPCHAAEVRELYNAPNIEMGTYEDLLEQRDIIRSSVLEGMRMPPGDGLSAEERELLREWLDCPQ